jgi:hypothetical protein
MQDPLFGLGDLVAVKSMRSHSGRIEVIAWRQAIRGWVYQIQGVVDVVGEDDLELIERNQARHAALRR